MLNSIATHYDTLIINNNDPFHDPPELSEYMNKWDGKLFIDFLKVDKSKTVLEIGVGTGRLASRVCPLCKTLIGIDISPLTIKRAKENLAEYSNISLICADFLTATFNATFDIIYSSLTFMHIKEKQYAVDKIFNLLNAGGTFVLSIDKNDNEYIDAVFSKIKIYPDTPKQISSCLSLSGFSIENTYETEFAYIFVAKK